MNLNSFYHQIATNYDLNNRFMSLGLDQLCRKQLASIAKEYKAQNLLDCCTGTGDQLLYLLKNASESTKITGVDQNENMLKIARHKLDKSNFSDIKLIKANVIKLPFENDSFDLITLSFALRNLIFQNDDAKDYLKELYRVLKPGGNLIILETSKPKNFLFRSLYYFYLKKILKPIIHIKMKDKAPYNYLIHSMLNFDKPKKIIGFFEKNQFNKRKFKSLFFGIFGIFIFEKSVNLNQKQN